MPAIPHQPLHTRTLTLGLTTALLLSACAHQPIIDRKGVNMAQYQQDLQECRAYADEVALGKKAAGGAAAGAVVGAAIGAAVGNSTTAKRAAGAGAVAGASKGTARGAQEKRQVINNCLRNRGYAVLN